MVPALDSTLAPFWLSPGSTCWFDPFSNSMNHYINSYLSETFKHSHIINPTVSSTAMAWQLLLLLPWDLETLCEQAQSCMLEDMRPHGGKPRSCGGLWPSHEAILDHLATSRLPGWPQGHEWAKQNELSWLGQKNCPRDHEVNSWFLSL